MGVVCWEPKGEKMGWKSCFGAAEDDRDVTAERLLL